MSPKKEEVVVAGAEGVLGADGTSDGVRCADFGCVFNIDNDSENLFG
jgi:hypothetical protein